jgi:protein SCO1/2
MAYKRNIVLLGLMLVAAHCWAAQRYPVNGIVLKVDRAAKTMVVSCQAVPNYMEAMTMPFSVRDPKFLDGLALGSTVEFTLVVEKDDSYAEDVRIHKYESTEQEPMQARRLKILESLSDPNPSAKTLAVGQAVPNFTLTDQQRHQVSLNQFTGKVVALNFVYTRCPLPQYCFRISNNFGRLRKRFREKLGNELVFLTVTFDPVHDTPEILAEYARTWKADPNTWHFLTGAQADVNRLTDAFGVGFWQDEASLTHSLHTAVIDRQGKLVANLEGNQFTPEQLGDLVQTVIDTKK